MRKSIMFQSYESKRKSIMIQSVETKYEIYLEFKKGMKEMKMK